MTAAAPVWPQPAGRAGKAPQTPANRAAALEAQAAALTGEMVRDLAQSLERSALMATEIGRLTMAGPDVRALAEKVASELTARAASFHQLAKHQGLTE